MRLIDADKLFDFIQKEKAWKQNYMEQNYMVLNKYNKGKYDAYYEMLNIIEEQPTIDAEPIEDTAKENKYNYCPNCGAKMDEEVQND